MKHICLTLCLLFAPLATLANADTDPLTAAEAAATHWLSSQQLPDRDFNITSLCSSNRCDVDIYPITFEEPPSASECVDTVCVTLRFDIKSQQITDMRTWR